MSVEQHKVEEFIYSNLSKVKRNGNGYVARCPVCGDSEKNASKRRLHVDFYDKIDEWVYTCYNGGCNASGNIISLYAHVMGCTYQEADNVLNDKKYDSEKLKKKLNGSTGTKYVDEKDDVGNTKLDLDLNFCYKIGDKPDNIQGKKYIELLKTFVKTRRVPYKKYKPLICFDGYYKNRYIIPVYDGDELVYFQARKIFDFMEPKFLNPDVVKESIILNRRVFDRDKYIIVTEGLLCAMCIGNQGTSCLGATVSDGLLEELFKLTDKGVIIALDNPLIDESGFKNYIKVMKESKYARKLKYFFMPDDKHKDINDIAVANEISYLSQIYDFIIKHSYSHFKSNHLVKSV